MFEKIGLHVIGNANVSLRGVPCVTLVNPSMEYVYQVLDETQWNAKVIIRWTAADSDVVWHPDMAAMPQHENVLFQGMNERLAKTQAQAGEWLALEMRRMTALHNLGRNAALLCPSVGQYEPDVWEMLRPIAGEMWANDAVVIHEYWTDGLDIGNSWHCARWAHTQWLHQVPIIVTEIGRDTVEGKGWSGWRRGGISSETYLAEIETYNRQCLLPFSNVIGGTIFTVGNDARWRDYDVSGVVWPEIQAQRRVRVVPPPAPIPAPPPAPIPAPPPSVPAVQGLSCEEVQVEIRSWRRELQRMAEEMHDIAERMCK